jgi:hypothetical protein
MKTHKHIWRILNNVVNSNQESGLTVQVYCFECGVNKTARIIIEG